MKTELGTKPDIQGADLTAPTYGQGGFATVNELKPARSLTGTKVFFAVLFGNLAAVILSFVVIGAIMSVKETNAALDRANQLGQQN